MSRTVFWVECKRWFIIGPLTPIFAGLLLLTLLTYLLDRIFSLSHQFFKRTAGRLEKFGMSVHRRRDDERQRINAGIKTCTG